MTLETAVATYGYPVLFAGTIIEGETVLLMAGFLAHRGYLDLHWVVLTGFLGAFLGDQTFFRIGRWFGLPFAARRPWWERKVKRIHALLDRHQVPVVLGFRFMYGFRTVTPLVLGASGFKRGRFLVLDAMGTLAWAFVIGCVGYQFGELLQGMLADVKRYEQIGLLVIAASGAVAWSVYFYRRKKEA